MLIKLCFIFLVLQILHYIHDSKSKVLVVVESISQKSTMAQVLSQLLKEKIKVIIHGDKLGCLCKVYFNGNVKEFFLDIM